MNVNEWARLFALVAAVASAQFATARNSPPNPADDSARPVVPESADGQRTMPPEILAPGARPEDGPNFDTAAPEDDDDGSATEDEDSNDIDDVEGADNPVPSHQPDPAIPMQPESLRSGNRSAGHRL